MSEKLYWLYSWRFAAKTIEINQKLNQIVTSYIKKQIINNYFTPEGIQDSNSQIFDFLEIDIPTQNQGTLHFRAILTEKPEHSFLINSETQIIAKFNDGSKIVNREMDKKDILEIKKFIEQELQFNPFETNNAFEQAIKQFQNLSLLKKEEILDELKHFFILDDQKEKWSIDFYSKVVPLVDLTRTKAPVLVFAGDPGTGKTALAFSIGAQISKDLQKTLHLWSISIAVRGTGYQGRSATMVAKLFDHAKDFAQSTNQPLLIVLDEAESVVGSRINADSSSGSEENVAIVNAIIRGIDQITKEKHRIAVIFISNIPERIDEALMRRGTYYLFPRPNLEMRKEIFAKALEGLSFSAIDIQGFVNATEPKYVDGKQLAYTGADIVEVILNKALQTCVKNKKRLDAKTILEICCNSHPTGELK